MSTTDSGKNGLIQVITGVSKPKLGKVRRLKEILLNPTHWL